MSDLDTPLVDAEVASIVPAQYMLPQDRLDTIQRNVDHMKAKGVPFNGVGVLFVSWLRKDNARFSATIIGGFTNAEKYGRLVQRCEDPVIVVIGRKPYQGLPSKGSEGTFVAPEHVVNTATEGERAVLAHEKKIILPGETS